MQMQSWHHVWFDAYNISAVFLHEMIIKINFILKNLKLKPTNVESLYTPISIKVASEKNDAWSMFHSPQGIIVASLVNYVPATNLESKRC